MNNKLFVIGLDGATLDLIQPWVDQGYLPNFQRMIEGGVSGPLMSTYPPLTGPAWSSFMTGKSPGRHGILEFFRREDGSYRQILNNRRDIDGKSIWGMLSENGFRVGVMGVPISYPPEAVNGFLITGLLTPHGRRDFTHPPELLDEIENKFGPYRLRHDEKYHPENPYPFINEQFEILKYNTNSALYLIKEKPWDFFMLHLLGTDRIQHEFWHTIDPKHPNHNPTETRQLGNIIRKFFIQVDSSLGKIFESLGEDVPVLLMSDHGFGPVYKFINFNVWLLKEGFLILKSSPMTRIRHLIYKMGFNYKILGSLILKFGLGTKAKQMGRAKREEWQRRIFLSLDDVDWSRSKAYSIGNFGQIFINLKGREPQGIVESGEEYESLLEELTKKLKTLKDPQTGEKVIEEIFLGKDLYTGPYTARSPDILFFTRNMEYKAMGLSDFASTQVFDPVFGTTGHHRMNGTLICYGPGVFRKNCRLKQANIIDLAPTILYMMGQSISTDLEGQVLLEIFTDEFNTTKTLTYKDEDLRDASRKEHSLTTEEAAELASRLRSLGYIN